MPRQLISTCAVLLEAILIKLHEENGCDIRKEIEGFKTDRSISARSRFVTLGKILFHDRTMKLLDGKTQELARNIFNLRPAGTHDLLTGWGPDDAEYTYKKTCDFAEALAETVNKNSLEKGASKINNYWADLKSIIRDAEQFYYFFSVQTVLCGLKILSEGEKSVSYVSAFDFILHTDEETKAVFAKLYKHGPQMTLAELIRIMANFNIPADKIKRAISLLSDLNFLFEGRDRFGQDIKISIKIPLWLVGKNFCSFYWDNLLGPKYLRFDKEGPRPLW